jgi:nitroreductase/NAD-dependent dihydropyrimidine dehydrogenase PreA subunit
MKDLIINESRCSKCGICADDCPMGIIDMSGGFPVLSKENESRCISCGHCLAVCPRSALSIGGIKPEDCHPIDKDMLPSFEETDLLIRARRSIRKYKEKSVTRETILQLIDTARYAPTASNSQLVRWTVIDSPDQIKLFGQLTIDFMKHLFDSGDATAKAYRMDKIVAAWNNGNDVVFRGAPVLVIAHAPSTYPVAVVDCSIALSYFDIASVSADLGSCWAGFFMRAFNNWEPLRKAVGLPEGQSCFGALMLGYPRYEYKRIPPRKAEDVLWK